MTTEDRLAEAYARGHFVATQRAISRQELGLPLEYGKTAGLAKSPLGGMVMHEWQLNLPRLPHDFEQVDTTQGD